MNGNQIRDISAISELTKLSELNVKSQTIEIKTGTKTIELPQIITAAKDPNSKVYTDQDYTLTNCTLSSDGTKVIVNTDNNEEASIKVNGGNASGTICTFVVDITPPEVEIKNSITTPTNKNVTVTITANKEIQEVSGWNLDSSKKILTKEYTQNGEETLEIKDLVGNTTTVNVKVNNIDKIAPKIEIKNSEQVNGKENTNSSNKAQQDNTTISNKILPKTGAGKIGIIIMLLLIVFGAISYKKCRKCKDI